MKLMEYGYETEVKKIEKSERNTQRTRNNIRFIKYSDCLSNRFTEEASYHNNQAIRNLNHTVKFQKLKKMSILFDEKRNECI